MRNQPGWGIRGFSFWVHLRRNLCFGRCYEGLFHALRVEQRQIPDWKAQGIMQSPREAFQPTCFSSLAYVWCPALTPFQSHHVGLLYC